MYDLTGTQLAAEVNKSKGAVSQWVSSGKLEGCYTGSGRSRRFDLALVCKALGRNIDPGQLLGNGAPKKTIDTVVSSGAKAQPKSPEEPDEYANARTEKAVEEARKLKRNNRLDEGTLVLAAEVHRQTSKRIGREVAEFESMLRTGARRIADEMGVDFKQVRQLLLAEWRTHRGKRAADILEHVEDIEMNEVEIQEDI